ncbi:hypothetical protein [Burkholderia ambifaria]|uniref:hypothetical protein n=1 Tax=Burkholderia ambifaria TaxID=152480 RepID=UPI00158B5267|nr:hypothetical protein [Burkholderia ambifaria]MBR8256819.1 hypothetical protein [Burkholderia ambifaria]
MVVEGAKAVLLDVNEECRREARARTGRAAGHVATTAPTVRHPGDLPGSLVRRAFAPIARHPGPARFPDSGGRPAADV